MGRRWTLADERYGSGHGISLGSSDRSRRRRRRRGRQPGWCGGRETRSQPAAGRARGCGGYAGWSRGGFPPVDVYGASGGRGTATPGSRPGGEEVREFGIGILSVAGCVLFAEGRLLFELMDSRFHPPPSPIRGPIDRFCHVDQTKLANYSWIRRRSGFFPEIAKLTRARRETSDRAGAPPPPTVTCSSGPILFCWPAFMVPTAKLEPQGAGGCQKSRRSGPDSTAAKSRVVRSALFRRCKQPSKESRSLLSNLSNRQTAHRCPPIKWRLPALGSYGHVLCKLVPDV